MFCRPRLHCPDTSKVFSEDCLLRQLNMSREEFEPFDNEHRDIYAWHTRAVETKMAGSSYEFVFEERRS